jgi:hypothetical protein
VLGEQAQRRLEHPFARKATRRNSLRHTRPFVALSVPRRGLDHSVNSPTNLIEVSRLYRFHFTSGKESRGEEC